MEITMHGASRSQIHSVPDRKFLGSNADVMNESILPSTSQATVKVELEDDGIPSEIGLGVFYGERGIPFPPLNDERYPVLVRPPLYASSTPNNAASPATLNPLLNGQQYPQPPHYQSYYESSAEHGPWIGISGLCRHDAPPPFYYSPDVHSKEDYSPAYSEGSEAWPMTPSAPSDSPSRASRRPRDAETSIWEAPLPSMFVFSGLGGVRDHLNVMRPRTVNDPLEPYLQPNHNRNTLVELDLNQQTYAEGLTTSDTPPDGPKKKLARQPRTNYAPANRGFPCHLCGSRFTRMSNCREHMRRHYPDHKQGNICEYCGKSFGRKTDLRRHISSVSFLGDQRDCL